jgi:hypothetical protein
VGFKGCQGKNVTIFWIRTSDGVFRWLGLVKEKKERGRDPAPEVAILPFIWHHGTYLEFHHLVGLGALRPLAYLAFNPVTFGKGLEALSLNLGMVNKSVFAVFQANETITLVIVEPLDCSDSH